MRDAVGERGRRIAVCGGVEVEVEVGRRRRDLLLRARVATVPSIRFSPFRSGLERAAMVHGGMSVFTCTRVTLSLTWIAPTWIAVCGQRFATFAWRKSA